MSARGPKWRPGEVIPGTKYQVVKALGAGGMGVVYQVVKPPNIGGVLKLMSAELASHEEHRMRFFDEVRILAQLDHPNIVRVFDYDALPDGTPFYVMELLTGRTVRDALHTMGRLPPRVAYEITRQLLEALQCAHTHEVPVIHRDIKPENIFLHAPRHGEPVVKLIDFGVSAVADRKHDGTFVGTWSYAAPEQIRGEPPTPQTDLYAVGLVLYEMLAGVGPFDHYDDWTKVSEAQLHEIPAPVSKFAPWVPPSIVTLIATALAKDPRVRPRDAYAFAEQLFELEWASDGKNPHDVTVEGPSAMHTPPQPFGVDAVPPHVAARRRSAPREHADAPVHVTGTGPLSYVLSTVTGAHGAHGAHGSSRQLAAAPASAPASERGNVARPAGVAPDSARTGNTWRGVGGNAGAGVVGGETRQEPTSPDANALLDGLLAEPRKPPSRRERESNPELDRTPPIGAAVSPRPPGQIVLRPGRHASDPHEAGPVHPSAAETLDEASAASPLAHGPATRDTFSSQQSDTPVIPRTRPSAWTAVVLGALLLCAGAVGVVVVRGRTPAAPTSTGSSVGASVSEGAAGAPSSNTEEGTSTDTGSGTAIPATTPAPTEVEPPTSPSTSSAPASTSSSAPPTAAAAAGGGRTGGTPSRPASTSAATPRTTTAAPSSNKPAPKPAPSSTGASDFIQTL